MIRRELFHDPLRSALIRELADACAAEAAAQARVRDVLDHLAQHQRDVLEDRQSDALDTIMAARKRRLERAAS